MHLDQLSHPLPTTGFPDTVAARKQSCVTSQKHRPSNFKKHITFPLQHPNDHMPMWHLGHTEMLIGIITMYLGYKIQTALLTFCETIKGKLLFFF